MDEFSLIQIYICVNVCVKTVLCLEIKKILNIFIVSSENVLSKPVWAHLLYEEIL